MNTLQSRREFIQRALAAGTAVAAAPAWLQGAPAAGRAPRSANDKLDLAVVGVGGRGHDNLMGVASENVVALCDIDQERLDKAAGEFPKAKLFRDFRKLLDETKLDALVVATPDHTHAMPVVWALQRGLDVYCEKPLAHNVYEIRQMRNWAAKQNAVTQMGTQIHAEDNYRRVVELVQAGTIGPVSRVHVWQGNSIQPGRRVNEGTPPASVDYDLWIGPAPMRPFDVSHFHFRWRYWWDFGGGILADMGCHYIDLPYWALNLRYATSVEARGEKTYQGDNEVPDKMQVDYHFPARGDQPPVQLTWYHGSWMPPGAEEYMKSAAVLFEGTKGRLLADYGTRKVFMSDGSTPSTPEPTIAKSLGHHREWIEACKSRGPTTCNFDYSGALAETVLLGNVSYRAGGQKLQWDAEKLTATNCPDAAQYLQREYRQGWKLEG